MGSMKSGRQLIVANWKMNPQGLGEAKFIFSQAQEIARSAPGVGVVVCPPFPYLGVLAAGRSKVVALGAQNLFWMESGAYTGEVSASMLADLGAKYCIVGHSERRALGETDAVVNKKILQGLKSGLSMIICIGEQSRDLEGAYLSLVGRQIEEALARVSKKDAKKIVIAYEPVWAIGKNAIRAASPADVQQMTIYVRRILSGIMGAESARAIPILYGGSVDTKNAGSFIAEGGAGGLLVGRESLNTKSFRAIVHAARDAR